MMSASASAACGTRAHDRRGTTVVVSPHVRRVVVRHEWCVIATRRAAGTTPRAARSRSAGPSRRRSIPFRSTVIRDRTHRRMAAPRGVQQRRPAVVAHRVDARARAKQLRDECHMPMYNVQTPCKCHARATRLRNVI